MVRNIVSVICAGLLQQGGTQPQVAPPSGELMHGANLSVTDPLAPFVLPGGIKSSKSFPDRVFRMKGGEPGVVFNGTRYPEIQMGWLPRVGRPHIFTRTKDKPLVRLVFLHGLGLDISNVGSVVPSLRILHRIASRSENDPLTSWMVKNHPELSFPMEIAAFDLPSAGWAPPIDQGFSAFDLAKHIEAFVEAMNEAEPLPTILVCRSASCAPSFLVGRTNIIGIVATGGTFPDSEVLHFNVDAIKAMEEAYQKKIARWDVIRRVVEFFKAPEFTNAFASAARGDLPVISLIGEADEETPERARQLWKEFLGNGQMPFQRSALILPGAGHQVFRPVADRSSVQNNDPDVLAFLALLRFVAYHAKVWTPERSLSSLLEQ